MSRYSLGLIIKRALYRRPRPKKLTKRARRKRRQLERKNLQRYHATRKWTRR